MELTDDSFILPNDFDAEEYYAHTVGIFVNDKLKPQKVVVRVFGVHVEYMRSLPLHFSQQEIKTEHKEYSDFEYQLCLTPELTSQLLAIGEKIEVMEPIGLREEIRKRLFAAINRYK